MPKKDKPITKVSDLFAVYKKRLRAPQRSVENGFIEVVEEVLEITLQTDQIRYQPSSRVLAITASGPIKSEIQLHQTELLAHMKARLGEKNSPEAIV